MTISNVPYIFNRYILHCLPLYMECTLFPSCVFFMFLFLTVYSEEYDEKVLSVFVPNRLQSYNWVQVGCRNLDCSFVFFEALSLSCHFYMLYVGVFLSALIHSIPFTCGTVSTALPSWVNLHLTNILPLSHFLWINKVCSHYSISTSASGLLLQLEHTFVPRLFLF